MLVSRRSLKYILDALFSLFSFGTSLMRILVYLLFFQRAVKTVFISEILLFALLKDDFHYSVFQITYAFFCIA